MTLFCAVLEERVPCPRKWTDVLDLLAVSKSYITCHVQRNKHVPTTHQAAAYALHNKSESRRSDGRSRRSRHTPRDAALDAPSAHSRLCGSAPRHYRGTKQHSLPCWFLVAPPAATSGSRQRGVKAFLGVWRWAAEKEKPWFVRHPGSLLLGRPRHWRPVVLGVQVGR